jgi:hypothetical protein
MCDIQQLLLCAGLQVISCCKPLLSQQYLCLLFLCLLLMPPLLLLLLQVFPTSGYSDLWDAISKGVATGGPIYHLAEYTVQDNAFLAVHGGWKVRG